MDIDVLLRNLADEAPPAALNSLETEVDRRVAHIDLHADLSGARAIAVALSAFVGIAAGMIPDTRVAHASTPLSDARALAPSTLLLGDL
ncbi:hypothetical protein [Allosphingosinicella vermicomposti]|uniref:hypothetical protein n=1 Tax=Allosphingosinicella vermicomposti TaxID=614671 RepID=UPI000D0E84A8|nr:hypothetical protein [Allosphingosinicella vermicomposti]